MKLFTSIWLIFISCVNRNFSENNKVALSHITLLLPYTSHYKQSPTRFKITSHGGLSNGCVEWTVEPKQDVIDIIPTPSITNYHRDECPPNTFNEAIIKAVSAPTNGRTSATITATDPKTGYAAECEVFIDKVHRLQVATSTRLIYLGKYESISVNGFDDKGNKFSTLHGVSMQWSGIKNHLQIISFEEASLMLPDVMNGHDLNRYRNPLPVKGIRTGQENVEVAIDTKRNPSHIGCSKTTAVLFVVMQLQLVPRTLYAAKCCVASFDLITTSHSELDLTTGNIKMNESYIYSDDLYGELKRQKIHIPQKLYSFKLDNDASKTLKMEIAQDGTLSTTNIIESGKLLVEDMVADESTDAVENNADARIFVIDAHRIYAEVIKNKIYKVRPRTYTQRKDETDWYLTYNEDYLIRLTLFDKFGNAMCVRDIHHSEFNQNNNMKFSMNLQSWKQQYICKGIAWNVEIRDHKNTNDIFAEIKQNEIDNQFIIKPSKIGTFTLKFSAKGTHCAYDEILATSTKKVTVTSPVSFANTSSVFCPNSEIKHSESPEKLILIPHSGSHNVHKVPVFFEGGSGRYRLEVNDTNIANLLNHDVKIGQDRHVSVIQAQNIGKTYLFLIDYFNPDNFAYIDVAVEWINVWSLDGNVAKEILIHDYIEIPLMIRDRRNRRFSALDGVQEVIKTSSKQQLVHLEFITRNIQELVDAYFNVDSQERKDDDGDNTQIIKNIKRATMNTLRQKGNGNDINCADMDGTLHVGGVNVGYDEFTITLYNKERNESMNTHMFVSVYDEIEATHRAVAIAININEAYTMHWKHGPNPWPIKDVLPVDDQFVHPLQVRIAAPSNNKDKDKKEFSFRYNGATLEFICYSEFHSFVKLVVQNRVWDSLPFPVQCSVEIEIFCFPQFKFNATKLEMGVGTRKSAKTLYPQWLQSSNISSQFFIEMNQRESEVISVVNNDDLVAKRLGSSWITAKLTHPTQRVHIHCNGFNDSLEIIVLFKGFTMEMPSYWIINGNDEIAHIEGLDEVHHILPFRHNFDDVFVEWHSEDANIVELLPILQRPSDSIVDSDERNNAGTGLSVKLMARSVGLVNIKAIIKLRNAPSQIKKTQFQLTQTVTVIPQVVTPCNSIIVKPNSSLSLNAQFNPDTNVAGIGQIYSISHQYSQMDQYLYVLNKKLNVLSHAPPAENVAVTLILQSEHHETPHKVKKYPLTQSASLIVSIVEPTGLNILQTQFITDNAVYSRSVEAHTQNSDSLMDYNQPFWSSISSSYSYSGAEVESPISLYSKTENILCVNQNITLKVAIVDELARKLHVMDDIKVISNDTSIVLPRDDIKISSADIWGTMYATVHLDALQCGYATITFREKDVSYRSGGGGASHHLYVYDDPTFLRTFLTIHVLSRAECQSSFGVVFEDESNMQSNDTKKNKNSQTTQSDETGHAKQNSDYKNGQNWRSNTAKLTPKDSNLLIAGFGIVIFLIIIGCTWGNCNHCRDLIGNNNNGMNNDDGAMPPAAFNPYRSMQNAVDQSNSFQSFNSSGHSNLNYSQSQWQM